MSTRPICLILLCVQSLDSDEEVFHLFDRVVKIAEGCPDLRRLKVAGCFLLEDKTILDLTRSCVKLQDVDFSRVVNVSDSQITTLIDYCLDLRALSIRGCLSVTDVGATAIARCKTLRKLKAGGCRNISDSGLIVIAESTAQIQTLDLSDMEASVTDACLTAFLKHKGRTLHTLNVTNNNKLTNQVLFEISKRGRELRKLNLTGGAKFQDDGINAVVIDCFKLRRLFLSGCVAITDTTLLMLSTHGNDLEELDIVSCSSTTLRCRILLAEKIPLVNMYYDKGELVGGAKTPDVPGFQLPPLASEELFNEPSRRPITAGPTSGLQFRSSLIDQEFLTSRRMALTDPTSIRGVSESRTTS